jgi:hypothetical protein
VYKEFAFTKMSRVDILGTLEELRSITNTIEQLREEIKSYAERKQFLVNKIVEYLEVKNEEGMLYKGILYKRTVRVGRGPKKREDKEKDLRDLLHRYGIEREDCKDLTDKVLDTLRGEVIETDTIKIENTAVKPRRRDVE